MVPASSVSASFLFPWAQFPPSLFNTLRGSLSYPPTPVSITCCFLTNNRGFALFPPTDLVSVCIGLAIRLPVPKKQFSRVGQGAYLGRVLSQCTKVVGSVLGEGTHRKQPGTA